LTTKDAHIHIVNQNNTQQKIKQQIAALQAQNNGSKDPSRPTNHRLLRQSPKQSNSQSKNWMVNKLKRLCEDRSLAAVKKRATKENTRIV
jgi:hypothetical protein